MSSKFKRYFYLVLHVLPMLIILNTAYASQEINLVTDCAVESTDILQFEGTLLFHSLQADSPQFIWANSDGQTIDYMPASTNVTSYYDPINSNILMFTTSEAESTNDHIEINVFTWVLSSSEAQIRALPISDSYNTERYNPIQWLGDNNFLFSDVTEDSFQIFSAITNEIHSEISTDIFPDMRLIPIQMTDEYDVAFSPNGRYVAYESEAINRGIVIWDLETSTQIAHFSHEYSGISVANPVWSYDSEKLAIALFVDTEMQLFIFDVASNQSTQITMFDTNIPEFGRPWSTIYSVSWSPDNRYVTFSGTLENSGLHILDTDTMSIRDTCINEGLRFWLTTGNLLVLRGTPTQILEVESNLIYAFPNVDGRPIGASPLSIDDLSQR